jgi:predicted ATPase
MKKGAILQDVLPRICALPTLLIYSFSIIMGNVVDKISANKVETLLLAAIASSGYLLYRQHAEKQELTQILLRTLQCKDAGVKDFENALNQVYLKEHIEQNSVRNSAEHPIYKVAITGGPCAGKSTSLKRIHESLTAKGFRVFSVPEVPTLVVQAGGMILMSKFNIQERIKFQSLLIRFQMYAEDYFTRLAEMSKSPSVVLCDRGTVDPAAYVSKEEFQAIMDEEGWSWVTLRDRRYDRVVFLSSAANGAEPFYTLENNVARSEGLDVARHLDKKTLEAWTGHPHITICPNIAGETFEQKIDRALRAVEKTVGLEMQNNRYEKYLIEPRTFLLMQPSIPST